MSGTILEVKVPVPPMSASSSFLWTGTMPPNPLLLVPKLLLSPLVRNPQKALPTPFSTPLQKAKIMDLKLKTMIAKGVALGLPKIMFILARDVVEVPR